MLACVSKQLPYRRGNLFHHLNEITKNKQGGVVYFRNETARKPIIEIHDKAEKLHTLNP